MTVTRNQTALPRYSIFASPVGPQIYLDPPDRPNGGEDEAAKAAAAAAAKEAADKAAAEEAARVAAGKPKPSDEEAKLLKEVMAKKEQNKQLEEKLKAFEGIDPAEVRKLLDERAAAAAAAKEAEKKAAEAAGDFERVKAMMAEEAKKEREAIAAEAANAKTALDQALGTINELTVGASFANSKLVKDELVLTPSKARVVYGAHFEVEGTTVVAYDKPKGAAERTKLVDASGSPLGFDEALKRLVDADPDRDALVKSKMAPGAGSNTTGAKPSVQTTEVSGVGRIQLALAAAAAKAKQSA